MPTIFVSRTSLSDCSDWSRSDCLLSRPPTLSPCSGSASRFGNFPVDPPPEVRGSLRLVEALLSCALSAGTTWSAAFSGSRDFYLKQKNIKIQITVKKNALLALCGPIGLRCRLKCLSSWISLWTATFLPWTFRTRISLRLFVLDSWGSSIPPLLSARCRICLSYRHCRRWLCPLERETEVIEKY